MKNLILGIAMIVLVSYDGTTMNREGFRHTVKVDLNMGALPFENLIDDYKYIKLELTDNSVLGPIKRVILYQSRIYVLTEIVHCFDLNGKFLFSVDRRGMGPYHFSEILHLSLDENRIIVTAPGGKILCYRSENGIFIDAYNLGYHANSVVMDGNTIYVDRGRFGNDYLKKNGRILIGNLQNPTTFDEYLSDQVPMLTSGKLTGREKTYYYNDPLKNQIYRFSNRKMEQYMQFDFGARNPTKADVNAIIANFGPTSKIAGAHFTQNFTENKHFAAGVVTAAPSAYNILYDKDNNRAICWSFHVTTPESAPYRFFPFMPTAFDDDYFYGVISAERMVAARDVIIKSGLTLNPSHPEYNNYKTVLDADINDNPVIALYRFKRLK